MLKPEGRVARQLHLVVARQRCFLRIVHAGELLGLVNLELPFSGRGLRPGTPGRRHAVEEHPALAITDIVATVHDPPYPERPINGMYVWPTISAPVCWPILVV